jgi:serine protease Do
VGALIGTAITGSLLQGKNPAAPVYPKELTSFRDVVKKVLPAVVSIEGKQLSKPKVSKKRTPNIDEKQLPEEFHRFFKDLPGGFPEMDERSQPQTGFGSGFLIDPKGVVLTNYHVVDGAEQVEVQLKDGRKFLSKNIKVDPKTDLAIVRIDAKGNLPYLELGDSDAMEIGDRVLAVGAPFGLTGSVTSGIISAKGRNGLNMNMYEDFLQTDAAINPGNSGGPLVNLEGRVVGIDSAIKSRSGGFQGVGLAVASNLAKNVMSQLLKDGVVRRGYLGVQIKDLEPDVAARLGVKEHGVLVAKVHDNTPAGKAGLKDGDVLTAVDGKPIKDGPALQRIVASLALNKAVNVTVIRDGKTLTLPITIEEQPRDFGNARVPAPRRPSRGQESVNVEKLGVDLADLTPDLAQQFGFSDTTKGAVITGVTPGSVADGTNLRQGMVIVKVDKAPVANAAEAKAALDKASLDNGVLLQVQSPQGGTNYIVVQAKTEKASK